MPFRSLMQGSLSADTLAFLEKFFLYGSMIYLLGNALGRRLPAAVITAALLFTTSWAEAWLPGRSAEITDTLMALIVAVIFALLPAEERRRVSVDCSAAQCTGTAAPRLAAGAGARAGCGG